MRAIWRGAISFGMVTIPVKLYTGTEQKDVRLRMLCRKHEAPIQEKRVCTEGGEELDWEELVRGYQVKKGEYVVLEPDEIDEAKPESSTTIDIGDFVEADEIDPVYFEKSYFLEPTDVGAKPFSLLKQALEETGRVALARVTIRTRERLATLRSYEDTLSLETMFWPDEIRSTGALDLPEGADAKVRPKELEMARSLVDSLSDRFKPDDYEDEYRSALEDLIERKMRGERRNAKRRKPEPKVIDLMDALKASVAESRKAGRDAKPRKRTSRSRRTKRAAAA
ncbi:MAG TPA: Ku protein [Candidatus Limnocylindria bacterium]|nr:Ku protein [Candidatus Limnocylindria bacterium]